MPAERTDLVLLTTTRREFEAATIAEALHSHRVTAEVVHTPSDGPGRGAPSPVEHRVMVPAGELARARELLKFIEAQSMHLSWAQPPAASASSPPPSEPRASPARAASPPAPPAAPPAGARHPEPAAGSKRVPLIVALAVIAAFVVIVLAIMGRPGS